eukprot:NODE_512_length_6656_cov_0.587006.p1 type:complete len:663 gc:universal NODE_512_length_6656_cov_0.587006:3267-5255(+)
MQLELTGIEYLLPNILQSCGGFVPEIDGADNLSLEEKNAVQLAAIENLRYLVPYGYKYKHLLNISKTKMHLPDVKRLLNTKLEKSFKSSEGLTSDYFGDLFRVLHLCVLADLNVEEDDFVSLINSITIFCIENHDVLPQIALIAASSLLDKIQALTWSASLMYTSFMAINSLLSVMNPKYPPMITEKCLEILPSLIPKYKEYKQVIFACIYTIRKSFYYHDSIDSKQANILFQMYNQYHEQVLQMQLTWDKLTDAERDFKPYLQFITENLFVIHKQLYTLNYFDFGHVDPELPDIQDEETLLQMNKVWHKARQVYQMKKKLLNTPSTPLFQELQADEDLPQPTASVHPVKLYHSKDTLFTIEKISAKMSKLTVRNRDGLFQFQITETGQLLPKLHNEDYSKECRAPLTHFNLFDLEKPILKPVHVNAGFIEELRNIDLTYKLQTVNVFVMNVHDGNKKLNRQFIKSIGDVDDADGDFILSCAEDEQYRFYFYNQLCQTDLTEFTNINLDGYETLDKVNAFVYFESYYSNTSTDELLNHLVDVSTNKEVSTVIICKQLKTRGLVQCHVYRKSVVKKLNQVKDLKEETATNVLYKQVYNSAPLYHNCIANVHQLGTLLKNTLAMFELMDKNNLDTDRFKLIKSVAARYTLDVEGPLQVAELLLC